MEYLNSLILGGGEMKILATNVNKALCSIENKIKQFEELNINPFPTRDKELKPHLMILCRIFKKLIFNFSLILLDSIKKDTNLRDMLKSLFSSSCSFKFIEQQQYKHFEPEKYCLTLMSLIIYNKEIHDLFKSIIKNEKKYYTKESTMNEEKSRLLKATEKIAKFDFSMVEFDLIREFKYFYGEKEENSTINTMNKINAINQQNNENNNNINNNNNQGILDIHKNNSNSNKDNGSVGKYNNSNKESPHASHAIYNNQHNHGNFQLNNNMNNQNNLNNNHFPIPHLNPLSNIANINNLGNKNLSHQHSNINNINNINSIHDKQYSKKVHISNHPLNISNNDSFLKSPSGAINPSMFQQQLNNNKKMEKNNNNFNNNFSYYNINTGNTINLNTIVSKSGNHEVSNNLFNPFSVGDQDSAIFKFIKGERMDYLELGREEPENKDKENDEDEQLDKIREKDFGCQIYYHNNNNANNVNTMNRVKSENTNSNYFHNFNNYFGGVGDHIGKLDIQDKFTLNKIKDVSECLNMSFFHNVFKKSNSLINNQTNTNISNNNMNLNHLNSNNYTNNQTNLNMQFGIGGYSLTPHKNKNTVSNLNNLNSNTNHSNQNQHLTPNYNHTPHTLHTQHIPGQLSFNHSHSTANNTLNNNVAGINQIYKISHRENITTNKYVITSIPTTNLFDNIEVSKREKQFSLKIKVIKKNDPLKFSLKDSIYKDNKQMTLTNSIVFYLNHFYNKEKFFLFPIKNVKMRPVSISEQNYQCYICFKRFNFIFGGIAKEKIYWCSYFMRYICKSCVSDDLSIIPAFVLNSWNFNKYSISIFGKNIIEKWEDKPVIHIKGKNPIIKLSSLLKQSITIKRKIHKIFDIMKCSDADNFVLRTLGEYKYLVFKDNYFSLNDLCGTNDYSFLAKLHDFFNAFEKHILKDCVTCHYKGSNCFICNKDQILMAYNIESTIYCSFCKRIFHKKCATFHPCLVLKK